MLFSINKGAKMRYLSSVSDIKFIRPDEHTFICGHAVFIALSSTGLTPVDSKRYIEQPPRPVSSALQLMKKEDTLRVWVLKDMLAATKHLKRQPKLAVDHYLRWGFKLKQDTVIIGGNECDGSTNLELLAFKNGRLISTQELSLYSRNHRGFSTQIELALSDLVSNFRGFQLQVTAPLSETLTVSPSGRICQIIDEEPFRQQLSVSLDYGEQSKNYRRFLMPIGIAVTSMVFYGIFVAYSWNQYHKAIEEYRTISKDTSGFDEYMLHELEAKRGFLLEDKPQIATIDKIRLLATAIASVEGVHIRKLVARNAVSQNMKSFDLPPDANFSVTADIPLLNDSTNLEQARPVLDQLAGLIGSKLRVIRQEPVNDNLTKQKRLVITFEGS